MKPINKYNEYRRQQKCLRKRKYHVYNLAMKVSTKMNLEKKTKKVRPYRCEYCNKFHIGTWNV